MEHRRIVALTLVLLTSLLVQSCLRPWDTQATDNPPTDGVRSGTFYNSLSSPFYEGFLIVGFSERMAADEVAKCVGGTVVAVDEKLRFAVVRLRHTVEEAYRRLTKLELRGIDYVEPRYVRAIPAFPEDHAPHVVDSRSNFATDQQFIESLWSYLWGLRVMGVESAWERDTTGAGVVVAVLDTGVDGTHPDLRGNVVKGYNAVEGTEIAAGTDSSFGGAHGTHVSGTVAALRDGKGVVGIAPMAKVMPVVIFGSWYVGDDRTAAAIRWAVDNGARVLNNSWGGLGYSMTLKRAIDYALERGVAVVAAAGNSTTYNSSMYPANYPGVIQVGAVEFGEPPRTASFSNRSPSVSVGAPGRYVLSTVPLPGSHGYEREKLRLPDNGATYGLMSGTSMATPHVSGLATLILQRHPEARPWQVRKLIERSAIDIDDFGLDPSSGYGLANVGALERALPAAGGADLILRIRRGPERPTGLAVTLIGRSSDGRPVRYFALSDLGDAKFLSIDSGTYEVWIAGPGLHKVFHIELATDTILDVNL